MLSVCGSRRSGWPFRYASSTEDEVDYVAGRTIEVVKRLRDMSPLYELAKEGVDIKSIQWKAE
jgi:hypothetical protein